MKTISVIHALHKEQYILYLTFSNGSERDVNFSNALTAFAKGDLSKYKNLRYFKQFKIENGNVVWGKNWDLIFPVEELYRGKINLSKTVPRKLKMVS
ncbi:MAG: DUF2442 domain-containing protein [Chitinophagales bacterium]|nr:DUF2442 domain-containing protein [Chitinophagales bacterium]